MKEVYYPEWSKYNKMIHKLQDSDWDGNRFLPSVEHGADTFIIMVGADWCPHCVNLKPELVRAASLLEDGDKIHFCKIILTDKDKEDKDGQPVLTESERNLIEQIDKGNHALKVEVYPTVFKIRNGKMEKINARTSEMLLKNARN